MSDHRIAQLPLVPQRPRQCLDDAAPVCALCTRPLGNKMEKHHLIPRLKGGTDTVPLHPICHRKIHSLFTESELAKSFNTIKALTDHPDIAAFIGWVRKRPADFHKRTRKMGGGKPGGGKGRRGRGQQ